MGRHRHRIQRSRGYAALCSRGLARGNLTLGPPIWSTCALSLPAPVWDRPASIRWS